MSAITLRLSESTSALLDDLATRLDLPREELAEQALQQFLAGEADMVTELAAGIADADQGRFASDERVVQVLNRFGVRLDR